MTVTGANIEIGDMIGSGTISGLSQESYGSMIELSWNGKNPIKIDYSNRRKFLEDGDEIEFRGFAEGEGYKIGFGECKGLILPALDDSFYF